MALDYVKLRSKALSLITETFGGQACTITSVDGNSQSGFIVFTTGDLADESIADVGTVQTSVRTAYINDVSSEPCVGDTVTTNSETYRIQDVRKYKPALTNVAYRLTLTR